MNIQPFAHDPILLPGLFAPKASDAKAGEGAFDLMVPDPGLAVDVQVPDRLPPLADGGVPPVVMIAILQTGPHAAVPPSDSQTAGPGEGTAHMQVAADDGPERPLLPVPPDPGAIPQQSAGAAPDAQRAVLPGIPTATPTHETKISTAPELIAPRGNSVAPVLPTIPVMHDLVNDKPNDPEEPSALLDPRLSTTRPMPVILPRLPSPGLVYSLAGDPLQWRQVRSVDPAVTDGMTPVDMPRDEPTTQVGVVQVSPAPAPVPALTGLQLGLESRISPAIIPENPIPPPSQGPAIAIASTPHGLVPGGEESRLPDLQTGLDPLPASPALVSTPPPSDPGRPVLPDLPRLMAQVAGHVVHHVDGKTEIALSPEELGHVRLSMQIDADNPDRMIVHLNFDRPETLDLFRRHADQLTQALRSAGYAEVDLGFGHTQGEDRRGPQPAPSDDRLLDRGASPPIDTTFPTRPGTPASSGGLDLRL